MDHTILGIHIQDRVSQVPDIQKIFTQYGCQIKMRLGIHDVDKNACSPSGIILLDTIGESGQIDQLMKAMNKMDGVEIQKMVFSH